MTNNGAVESFEIERKYEVSGEAILPTAESFKKVGLRPGEPNPFELRATYFDTPKGELASKRIAMRNRLGGKDEGWHLKFKGADGARELLWAPSEDLPEGMRNELVAILGEDAVATIAPIATLRTHRVTTLLYDASDKPVIELADDTVDAKNELAGVQRQWREWESELVSDDTDRLLDKVEPLLVEAGATRVRGTSKIQRTMQP